jgi:membrane-associated PAP2 superfamily phosphatase
LLPDADRLAGRLIIAPPSADSCPWALARIRSKVTFKLFSQLPVQRGQQTFPASSESAMLPWALMASCQIAMRKVDGWESLAQKSANQTIDLAA